MASGPTDLKVLFIRNLPAQLSVADKEDFLRFFGPKNITILGKLCARLEFDSDEAAKEVMMRMHQLDLLGNKLIVKYGKTRNIIQKNENIEGHIQPIASNCNELFKRLLAINKELDFTQPPPHHMKYSYPQANAAIIRRIGMALKENSKFYTQVLHLMNRMNLTPPFEEDCNENRRDNWCQTDPLVIRKSDLATDESELESDVEESVAKKRRKISFKDRPNKIKALLRSEKLTLALETVPKVLHKDVFDHHEAPTKRIEIVVSSKLAEIEPKEMKTNSKMETLPNLLPPTVTNFEDLTQNRIPWDQLKENPIFKNYNAGAPSNVLYVKNLAKTTTQEDLQTLFLRYERKPGDIVVDLKTQGKLRGQAWLTFNIPYEMVEDEDAKIGERQIDLAIKELNGYILKDKPMFVCFAKRKT